MAFDTTNDGRALQRLLDELGRLPGIGPKSAQRIAYHLLEVDSEEARRLAQAILELKQQVHFCPICFNYATRDWTLPGIAVKSAWSLSLRMSRQSSVPVRFTASTTSWAA